MYFSCSDDRRRFNSKFLTYRFCWGWCIFCVFSLLCAIFIDVSVFQWMQTFLSCASVYVAMVSFGCCSYSYSYTLIREFFSETLFAINVLANQSCWVFVIFLSSKEAKPTRRNFLYFFSQLNFVAVVLFFHSVPSSNHINPYLLFHRSSGCMCPHFRFYADSADIDFVSTVRVQWHIFCSSILCVCFWSGVNVQFGLLWSLVFGCCTHTHTHKTRTCKNFTLSYVSLNMWCTLNTVQCDIHV